MMNKEKKLKTLKDIDYNIYISNVVDKEHLQDAAHEWIKEIESHLN